MTDKEEKDIDDDDGNKIWGGIEDWGGKEE
jgi:hypothetical protein